MEKRHVIGGECEEFGTFTVAAQCDVGYGHVFVAEEVFFDGAEVAAEAVQTREILEIHLRCTQKML